MSQLPAKSCHYLTFSLGVEHFGIDVQQVREVIEDSPITQVPQTAEFMLGVINVRGSAIPIIDLRARFGLAKVARTRDARIIILDLSHDGDKVPMAALADRVNEVVEIEPDQIAPPPRIATQWRPEFLIGFASLESQFLILLDIDRVFSTTETMLVAEIENHEIQAEFAAEDRRSARLRDGH